MTVQEQILWSPGIYQLEQTDLVFGGANGIANQQAKDLANRTLWLKNELYKLSQLQDVADVTASRVIDKAERGFLFVLSKPAGPMDIQLPLIADVPKGSIFSITTQILNGPPANIIAVGNDRFVIGFNAVQNIYLHSCEAVILVADGNFWRLASYSGNLFNVGNPFYGYKQQLNTLVRNGQLVNRADFPRLWQWAQTLQGETLVNDYTWNSDIIYQGCFSSGDGATNFRLPDDRAMFERALDLGRGIDLDRPYNFPGGYEKDEIIAHDHKFKNSGDSSPDNNANGYVGGNNTDGRPITSGNDLHMEKTGGRETRPKNIGKIPLISY